MYLRRDRILTALAIMLDVAFYAGRSGVASGSDIAKRNGLMRRGIEPILQALSKVQLLDSIRGPRGGYRLAKSPRLITLKEIARIFIAHEELSELSENTLIQRVLIPYWQQLDSEIEEKLGEQTLGDLLLQAEKVGLSRPNQVPLSFSI